MFDTWGIYRAYNNYKNAITNRLYIGEVYGIENAFPALISTHDFELAGEIMKQRIQLCCGMRKGNVYLFSGILRCRECGQIMQSNVVKGYKY